MKAVLLENLRQEIYNTYFELLKELGIQFMKICNSV